MEQLARQIEDAIANTGTLLAQVPRGKRVEYVKRLDEMLDGILAITWDMFCDIPEEKRTYYIECLSHIRESVAKMRAVTKQTKHEKGTK